MTMRNALSLAIAALALLSPPASWAAETSNDVPVYDPYQSYSSVVTRASMPLAGSWDGVLIGPEAAVAQIPEPGSIVLVLAGLGALAYSIRRRKRR